MGYALIYAGTPEKAIEFVRKSMRLDPHYPAYYLFVLGLAYFGLEQLEEAVTSFETALKRNPENYVALIPLAATYAHLDLKQQAAAAVAELQKIQPIFTVSLVMECPLWAYKKPIDKGRLYCKDFMKNISGHPQFINNYYRR